MPKIEENKPAGWGRNATHMGVEVLPNGKEITLIIDHIEAVKDELVGDKTKDGHVIIFKPNEYSKLPMWINSTNQKVLLKLARKTPWQIQEIKNFPVILTWSETQVGAGLRISKNPAKMPVAKQEKQALTEDKLAGAIEFLKTKTMKELEEFYVVSDEMKGRLKNGK